MTGTSPQASRGIFKDYIKKMKMRDPELSKGWGQIVTPLTIHTPGGPQKVNCAPREGVFRIIQAIPSPKAEPFKRWMAQGTSGTGVCLFPLSIMS